jgi:hypothetical protein
VSTLLETVTLDDWQDLVNSALMSAKQGDAQARVWLVQYLVGKPSGKAPTPLNIVVQQLNGDSPLIDRLAKPVLDRYRYPSLHENDAWEDKIKALVAAELAEKVSEIGIFSSPELARLEAQSGKEQ